MTTKERLRIIEATFSQLGYREFRREMRELIDELQFVHQNHGVPQAYHRYDGCGKGSFSGEDRALGRGKGLPGKLGEGLWLCKNDDCRRD